ncbi:MAG: hypothetical protein QM532_00045 [Cyanobium sp. MAG06]|nr:hypothetical protein [Cyanobium sp. MAG06]
MSGARGTMAQLIQLSGMKGVIVNNLNKKLEFPVLSSYIEGLNPVEYFVTTYGARKGSTDTALKTAQAGYLTRKLVDVSQDVIIRDGDCKTKNYKTFTRKNIFGDDIDIAREIKGRILAKDIAELGFKKDHLLSVSDANIIRDSDIKEVCVRTPITCESNIGVCQKCYGLDMGRNKLVDIGETVGIVAAQAIGEPGTQLTMRTFHSGGVAGADITQGLPRVEEIFENRVPKAKATLSEYNGEITEIGKINNVYVITMLLNDTEIIKSGKDKTIKYELLPKLYPIVKKGDKIIKSQILSTGSVDMDELFKLGGADRVEEYVVREIYKVYDLQGANINRKHLEIIIRQMLNRVKIKDSKDSIFIKGDIIERGEFIAENQRLLSESKNPADGVMLLKGISEVALSTSS